MQCSLLCLGPILETITSNQALVQPFFSVLTNTHPSWGVFICKIKLFDHLLHAICSKLYNLREGCASRQVGTANCRHGEWRWLVNTRAPLADWASRVHTALSRLPPFLSSLPTSGECFDFLTSKSSKTLENSPMPTDVNQLMFRLLSMTIFLSAYAAEKFGAASANCFPLMTRGNVSSAPKSWTNAYWSSVYVRSKK